jgi:hypothetical protein
MYACYCVWVSNLSTKEKGYYCNFEKNVGHLVLIGKEWEVESKPRKNVTLGVKFVSP